MYGGVLKCIQSFGGGEVLVKIEEKIWKTWV